MFESAPVSGVYIFPEKSQLNAYSEESWDQGSDYIRLPQKLLSQDRCKYSLENLLMIKVRLLTILLSMCFLNSLCNYM